MEIVYVFKISVQSLQSVSRVLLYTLELLDGRLIDIKYNITLSNNVKVLLLNVNLLIIIKYSESNNNNNNNYNYNTSSRFIF